MMKKSSKYVYYSVLSQKILKIKYLHIFFLFIENFLTMFLIFDCSNIICGKTNIHLKLIQICNLNHYLNQSLVLCIIVLFFLLIYLFFLLFPIISSLVSKIGLIEGVNKGGNST